MSNPDAPIDPEPVPDSEPEHTSPILSGLKEGTENFYTGSEPFFTYFTQTQILLSSIRLTMDSQVIVPTADLAAMMESARRGFQHSGSLKLATQDAGRIAAMFGVRIQAWEREVQGFGRDKRQMSGAQIQRLKAEAALIRGKIQAIQRAMVKLDVMLHQMSGEESSKSSD